MSSSYVTAPSSYSPPTDEERYQRLSLTPRSLWGDDDHQWVRLFEEKHNETSTQRYLRLSRVHRSMLSPKEIEWIDMYEEMKEQGILPLHMEAENDSQKYERLTHTSLSILTPVELKWLLEQDEAKKKERTHPSPVAAAPTTTSTLMQRSYIINFLSRPLDGVLGLHDLERAEHYLRMLIEDVKGNKAQLKEEPKPIEVIFKEGDLVKCRLRTDPSTWVDCRVHSVQDDGRIYVRTIRDESEGLNIYVLPRAAKNEKGSGEMVDRDGKWEFIVHPSAPSAIFKEGERVKCKLAREPSDWVDCRVHSINNGCIRVQTITDEVKGCAWYTVPRKIVSVLEHFTREKEKRTN